MWRWLLPAMLLVVYTLLLPMAVAAQDDDLTVTPRLGFDNIIAAERWAPVRFVLTTSGEPVAGTLTLRYRQDGSQDASTTVRFSLTPGVPTPVDVGVCLQRFADGLSLTIRSDAGRTLLSERIEFSNPGGARRMSFVPPAVVTEPMTLLAVGLDDLAEIGREWSRMLVTPEENAYLSQRDQEPTIERQHRLSVMKRGDLFDFWSAYDGVAAVLVQASVIDELPERARRALLTWQSGGGELIIIVDEASRAWRRWLPEGSTGDVVAMDEPRRLAAPGSFMRIPTRVDRTGIGDADLAATVTEIDGRGMVLTQGGASRGWRLLHELDGEGGLAARGPVGLGFVTILSFDPARAMRVQSRSSASMAWAAVLEPLIVERDPVDPAANYYAAGSGATAAEVQAIDRLVNSGVRGEGITLGVLLAVLAVLMVFVLGIGPVDAFILRWLRLRHWSWLSALVWVGAASVLAVQIPSLNVGGGTNVGRLTITDSILDERGGAVASWSTAVTTIYAGAAGRIGPEDGRAGAWWRGVSPLEIWQWGGQRPAGAIGTLWLTQLPMVGEGGVQESVVPGPLSQRGWTARALLDTAPEGPPVVARVVRDGGLRLEMAITSPDIRVSAASVIVQNRRWTVRDPPLGRPIELADSDAAGISRTEPESLIWAPADGGIDWQALTQLPGVPARGRALEAQTHDERFALIEIIYAGGPLPFPVTGADRAEQHGVVRLAVPVLTLTAEPAQ